MVAERLAELPGEPVIGWGHRSPAGTATRPSPSSTRSPETPVMLISGDGHHAWLNTPP